MRELSLIDRKAELETKRAKVGGRDAPTAKQVDRVKKGLLIDYGAFSFGIGDSPTGGIILGGASFGLPRWMPGSRLIPDRIREELQIDVGIRLPIDTMNVREWQPNFGIGVKLLHW